MSLRSLETGDDTGRRSASSRPSRCPVCCGRGCPQTRPRPSPPCAPSAARSRRSPRAAAAGSTRRRSCCWARRRRQQQFRLHRNRPEHRPVAEEHIHDDADGRCAGHGSAGVLQRRRRRHSRRDVLRERRALQRRLPVLRDQPGRHDLPGSGGASGDTVRCRPAARQSSSTPADPSAGSSRCHTLVYTASTVVWS